MVKTIQIISKSLFSKVNYSFKSHGHMENIFFWVGGINVCFVSSQHFSILLTSQCTQQQSMG